MYNLLSTGCLLPEVTAFVIEAFLAVAVQVEISAAKTVLYNLCLFQQTAGKIINVMSHENGHSLPRNRIHSAQINFEETQLKFIRYDSTVFVRRMFPSYYLPSYDAPCLRSKISVKHCKTDSFSSSDLAESIV